MYKKGLAIMLIGFSIIIFSAMIIALNFNNITSSLNKSYEKEGKIVKKEILVYDLSSFKLDTKNDKVKIVKSDSDKIEVSYYEYENRKYDLINQNGTIVLKKQSLPFKLFYNDFKFLGFLSNQQVTEVKIPEKLIKNMTLNNSNAEVSLENWTLDNLSVLTSNGKIEMENVTVQNNIKFNTGNASIYLQNFNAPEIDLNTSNGGIELYNVNTNKATLHTNNASVMVKESNIIDSIYAKSSNGRIELDKFNTKSIEAVTSNASISLNLDAKRQTYNEKLKTSNGSIRIDGDKLSDKNIEKTYNESEKSFNLKTSNGSIAVNYNKK